MDFVYWQNKGMQPKAVSHVKTKLLSLLFIRELTD